MDASLKLTQATLGAQVLSACVPSIGELFYRSCVASSLGQVTRGGVPVLFPQFADRGVLPKHGFARHCYWSSGVGTEASVQCYSLKNLEIQADDFSGWPHSAKLVLETHLGESFFQQDLTVTNSGSDSFIWSGGLHPYFLIEDLQTSSLSGLGGIAYKDRYFEESDLIGESHLVWDEHPCEKLFESAPPLLLSSGSKELRVSTTGFDQWMIWNPGKSGAAELADMEDGDWQRFVCIEPVCVDRPIMLMPEATFSGSMKIEWDI